MTTVPKTKTKKGFKGIGLFLFGMFFGLIFTLASLIGVGFWAYKNLNLARIEKLSKTEINVSTDIKKITIEDIVNNVSAIVKNIDSYTISQLEDDFDIVIIGENGIISNSYYGIDLTRLKNSTKSTFKNDFMKIINNVTLDTLLEFLNTDDSQLGAFSSVINTNIEYYYNEADGHLYSDAAYSKLCDFDYTIENNNVTIGNSNTVYPITDNKIAVAFRNIPIESAFNSFDNVTNNLEIGELLGYYKFEEDYYTDENHTPSNKVTGFISTISKKKIGELNSEFINNLKLYEVLDLTRTGNEGNYKYIDENGNEVPGIINAIAEKTIPQLTEDSTINNLHIYEVMNYHKNESDKWVDSNNNEITGILNAIADTTILNLSDKINTITLSEILNLTNPTGVLKSLQNSTISSLEQDINNLSLGDALGIEQSEATGIIKTLYSEKINQLSAQLNPNTLTIAKAMGYYENPTDGKYYMTYDGSTYSDEVTGVLATLAPKTLNNIDEGINEIKVFDVIQKQDSTTSEETPLYALFSDDANRDNITISQLQDKLINKINNSTIGQLIDAGLIDNSTSLSESIRSKTINELIEYVNQLESMSGN